MKGSRFQGVNATEIIKIESRQSIGNMLGRLKLLDWEKNLNDTKLRVKSEILVVCCVMI